MNKLSKILLGVVIVLVVALGVLTYEYIEVRKSAQYSLDSILELSEELQKAYIRIEELEKGNP